MSRTSEILNHLFTPETDVATKLNITPRMLQRIKTDDKNVRPWLMRYLVDRYKVNPLYIYRASETMLLSY
jgi:hypothetical protein